MRSCLRPEGSIERGSEAETRQAKVIALSNFLEEVLEVELVDILPGVEHEVGSRVLGVSGRIDLLYQGLVVEMKTDFDDERSDAVEKLRDKYFPTILEKNQDQNYVALITDMQEFELVRPVIEGGEVIGIHSIDEIDTNQESIQDTLFWLDSAIFSSKVREPSADELLIKFGPESPTYELGTDVLSDLWSVVEDKESVKIRLNLWIRMMEIVYGNSPDVRSFVAQTYLSILVKLLVRLRINPTTPGEREELEGVITGEYFSNHGITNLIEDDFFTWILDETVKDPSLDICERLSESLNICGILDRVSLCTARPYFTFTEVVGV